MAIIIAARVLCSTKTNMAVRYKYKMHLLQKQYTSSQQAAQYYKYYSLWIDIILHFGEK